MSPLSTASAKRPTISRSSRDPGSGARSRPATGLVDELRLVVFPVLLGDGERPFGDTPDPKPLRLLEAATIGAGLSYLRYELVRDSA
jgi:hypothetical protein